MQKIEKLEARIDWKSKAEDIIAKINAFNPKPGAWFLSKKKESKFLRLKKFFKKEKKVRFLMTN